MKTVVKNFLMITLISLVVAGCSDQFEGPDTVGTRAIQPTVNLGLPPAYGGLDPVDRYGNVTVTRNVHLYADTTYILHNYFRIQNGFTLTIDAGVTLKGEQIEAGEPAVDIAPGTLVIQRGARIHAAGTASNPIVFTSNQSTPEPGDWGGIVLLGKADVNLAGYRGATPSGTDGLGFVEGLPAPSNTGRYGNGDLPPGNYNADNSGTMQYVRIEYAGHVIGYENELNGLTLAGVGCGTTLDHLMVTHGFDDAFEFFGGCVNAKYLIASENQDDDFDTDQGYFGKIQFGISRKTPTQNIVSYPINGFESNGDNDDDYDNNPLTNGTFSNFTVIGPVFPNSTSVLANYNSGALIRDDSHLNIFNSIIMGYPNYQVELETPGDFDNDENDYTDGRVSMEGVTLVAPGWYPFTSSQCTNVTDFTNYASYHNECWTVGIGELDDYTGISETAWNTHSDPIFTASYQIDSDFSNDLVRGNFFTQVDFRGAFGYENDVDWHFTDGWVKW